MRTFIFILAALVGGFIAGVLLSEAIGIAGVVLFQRAIGIRYLPVYLALLFALAALIADQVIRRNSR